MNYEKGVLISIDCVVFSSSKTVVGYAQYVDKKVKAKIEKEESIITFEFNLYNTEAD